MILSTAEFLLPRKGVDMSKWAAIACDQFTSDRAYWDKLDAYVGDAPSTLRLILPEVYLGDGDGEKRAADIYAAMERYCADGTLEGKRGFVVVDRRQNDGRHRLGAVAVVDLEEYEYTPRNNARIKATEKTVEERLPARVKLREKALLEASHIMLLAENVRPLLEALLKEGEEVYDFELNMNGGHLTGRLIDDESKLAAIEAAALKAHQSLAFVVGDGRQPFVGGGEAGVGAGQRDNSPKRVGELPGEVCDVRDRRHRRSVARFRADTQARQGRRRRVGRLSVGQAVRFGESQGGVRRQGD